MAADLVCLARNKYIYLSFLKNDFLSIAKGLLYFPAHLTYNHVHNILRFFYG